MGVCRRLLGNREDAEDAFQAVFLILARKAGSIRPREKVGNWLHGVAYRTSLKAKVMRAKRFAKERRVGEMQWPPAAQVRMWEELVPLLDKELNGLPANYRSAVVLCDLEGKSRKEAARKLGWSEGTLSGRLARARALLARRLSRYGLSISGGALAAMLSEEAASACLSPGLVTTTTKAAVLMAAGQASLAGVVSAKVIALTEGVMKAMLLTKLKIATMVLVSLIPGRAQAQKQEAPAKAAASKEVPAKEQQSKEMTEAQAELGKAQVEVAEAQLQVAQAQLNESKAAIQIAESEVKARREDANRMEKLAANHSVSHEELNASRFALEKSENELMAKRVALKTAEARVAVAKGQLRVVIAQVRVASLQP
jgi:RNA polymerase sigma factor (sigma-70 family)